MTEKEGYTTIFRILRAENCVYQATTCIQKELYRRVCV